MTFRELFINNEDNFTPTVDDFSGSLQLQEFIRVNKLTNTTTIESKRAGRTTKKYYNTYIYRDFKITQDTNTCKMNLYTLTHIPTGEVIVEHSTFITISQFLWWHTNIYNK